MTGVLGGGRLSGFKIEFLSVPDGELQKWGVPNRTWYTVSVRQATGLLLRKEHNNGNACWNVVCAAARL